MAIKKKVGLNNRVPIETKTEQVREHMDIINTSTEYSEFSDLAFFPGIDYRNPRELKSSFYNKVFDHLKNEEYWTRLKEDISSAGSITDPLLILPDGEIVSGHSRRKVAMDLLASGKKEFSKIPVRVIKTKLSDSSLKKRVYLSNLSRFEIDTDTRLKLYSVIYPEYFHTTSKPGVQTATVAVSRIAESLGVKERQVRNERQVYQKAKDIALAKGKDEPDSEEIRLARDQFNQARRESRKQKKNNQGNETLVILRGDEVLLDRALLLTFATAAGAELRDGIMEYINQWSGS